MKFKVGDKVRYKGTVYVGITEGKVIEERESKQYPYKVMFCAESLPCSEDELELIEEDPICFPVDPPNPWSRLGKSMKDKKIPNTSNEPRVRPSWKKFLIDDDFFETNNFQIIGKPNVSIQHIKNVVQLGMDIRGVLGQEWIDSALKALDKAIKLEKEQDLPDAKCCMHCQPPYGE